MATRAENFRSEQERSKPPMPKTPVKESRATRTALRKSLEKALGPTKSDRGSEHAEQMKSATAESRHNRRGG